jgi:hypothetical protein
MSITLASKTVVFASGGDGGVVVPSVTKTVEGHEYFKLSKHADPAMTDLIRGDKAKSELQIFKIAMQIRNISIYKLLNPEASEQAAVDEDFVPPRLNRKEKRAAIEKLPKSITIKLPGGTNGIAPFDAKVLTAMGKDPVWLELTAASVTYLRDFTTNQEHREGDRKRKKASEDGEGCHHKKKKAEHKDVESDE